MATLGGLEPLFGDAAFSGSGAGGRTYFMDAHHIISNGSLESADIYTGSSSGSYDLKIKIFRPSGGDYNFIGESQVYNFTGTSLKTVTLDTPISVLVGDIIALWLSASSDNKIRVQNFVGQGTRNIEGDATATVAESSTSLSPDYSMSLQVFGVLSGSSINATLGVMSLNGFDATIVEGADIAITTEPLKNNTGTLLTSTGSITADVYNISTGALVVRKTGLTSDASGVVSFTDPLLVTATEYRVIISISTSDGVARITTS